MNLDVFVQVDQNNSFFSIQGTEFERVNYFTGPNESHVNNRGGFVVSGPFYE